MINKFIKFSIDYVNGNIKTKKFVDKYFDMVNESKKGDELLIYKNSLVITTIFGLCDIYNEDEDRESYELNENGLRNSIKSLLSVMNYINEKPCYDDVPQVVKESIENYIEENKDYLDL